MPPPGWRVDGRVHCFSVPSSKASRRMRRAGSSLDADAIRPRESVWRAFTPFPFCNRWLHACCVGMGPGCWGGHGRTLHCLNTARCILSPVLGRVATTGTPSGSSGAATQVRMIRWGPIIYPEDSQSCRTLRALLTGPVAGPGGACHEIPRVCPPYSAGAEPVLRPAPAPRQ